MYVCICKYTYITRAGWLPTFSSPRSKPRVNPVQGRRLQSADSQVKGLEELNMYVCICIYTYITRAGWLPTSSSPRSKPRVNPVQGKRLQSADSRVKRLEEYNMDACVCIYTYRTRADWLSTSSFPRSGASVHSKRWSLQEISSF